MDAWLTPDSSVLIQSPDCRTISVSGDLFSYVSGALEMLADDENWEQFGTATPSEVASHFRDVLDNYYLSICGGSMNFISTSTHNLVTVLGGSGTSAFPIFDADLPVEAQGASAIYVNVRLQRLSGTFVQQLRMSDQANIPISQVYDTGVADETKGCFWLPMRSGGALFRLVGSGNTVNFFADLIGWM